MTQTLSAVHKNSLTPFGDQTGADAAVELLKKLAHPARLMIVCRLVAGACTVGDLEAELGLKQPSLSQQLGELRNAGIIAATRDQRQVRYALADRNVKKIIETLSHIFCPDDSFSREETTAAPEVLRVYPASNVIHGAVFARILPRD